MFIFLSILNLIISSIPNLANCNNDTHEVSISEVDDYQDVYTVTNSTLVNTTDYSDSIGNSTTRVLTKKISIGGFFSNCVQRRGFELVDMICIIWFTVEFLLRFFSCPDKLAFVKSIMNGIDFFATFPYYIEIVIFLLAVDDSVLNRTSVLFFTICRSLTILRILKLARYFKDLRILGQTFKEARRDLLMMVLFTAVNLLLFSAIVYDFEKDTPDTKFTSIPAACWWGIVTLTTVGYGDMTPVTVGGKIIGCVACITGILMTAMPVSVLVEHFLNAYKKKHVAADRSATAENLTNETKEKIIFIKNQIRVKNLKRLIKNRFRSNRK